MDEEMRQKLEVMEKQMAEVHAMARKLYRILLVTIIVSVLLFILPLIGLFIEIPNFINTYSTINSIGGLQ